MTPWLKVAFADYGVAEARAPTAVLQMFRDAGRHDIDSASVHWCAAYQTAVLQRAGIHVDIPHDLTLMAKSFETFGTACAPKPGAIAVFKRSGPAWARHVGNIVAVQETRLLILGGNQSNSVNLQWFARSELTATRWPPAQVLMPTARAAARVDTAAAEAQTAQHDASKSVVVGAAGQAVSTIDATSIVKDAGTQAKTLQTGIDQIWELGAFLWDKAPWLLGVLAIFYGVRAAWSAGLAAWFRRQALPAEVPS
ncbi:MAG: TIGR02594 family protein [Pseudomonadota bacterium]